MSVAFVSETCLLTVSLEAIEFQQRRGVLKKSTKIMHEAIKYISSGAVYIV